MLFLASVSVVFRGLGFCYSIKLLSKVMQTSDSAHGPRRKYAARL